MSKINQNSKKKPKRQLSRYIILPLKKPLAKFLTTDFGFLYDLLSEEEVKKQINLYETHLKPKGAGKSNLKIIKQNTPELIKISEWFEMIQISIINTSDFRYLFEGYKVKKIERREDFEAIYYRHRKNLPVYLKQYTQKGFSLVKFTFRVTIKKENKEDRTLEKKITQLNDLAYSFFLHSLFHFIETQKTIKQGIDLIFSIAGFKENELKEATLKRYYYQWKKTANEHSLFEKNYDKKLTDSEIFSIVSKRLNDNYSYSKIADMMGISKTKVINICKNPDILKFYFDVRRYSDNYFDFFLQKPIVF